MGKPLILYSSHKTNTDSTIAASETLPWHNSLEVFERGEALDLVLFSHLAVLGGINGSQNSGDFLLLDNLSCLCVVWLHLFTMAAPCKNQSLMWISWQHAVFVLHPGNIQSLCCTLYKAVTDACHLATYSLCGNTLHTIHTCNPSVRDLPMCVCVCVCVCWGGAYVGVGVGVGE